MSGYFCHACDCRIERLNADYTCPLCFTGFVEEDVEPQPSRYPHVHRRDPLNSSSVSGSSASGYGSASASGYGSASASGSGTGSGSRPHRSHSNSDADARIAAAIAALSSAGESFRSRTHGQGSGQGHSSSNNHSSPVTFRLNSSGIIDLRSRVDLRPAAISGATVAFEQGSNGQSRSRIPSSSSTSSSDSSASSTSSSSMSVSESASGSTSTSSSASSSPTINGSVMDRAYSQIMFRTHHAQNPSLASGTGLASGNNNNSNNPFSLITVLTPSMNIDIGTIHLRQNMNLGPPPLPSQQLSQLKRSNRFRPTIQFLKSKPQCCVCFEEFVLNEDTLRLNCTHVFHDKCILPWLALHGTCPLCRTELNPDQNQSQSHDEGLGPRPRRDPLIFVPSTSIASPPTRLRIPRNLSNIPGTPFSPAGNRNNVQNGNHPPSVIQIGFSSPSGSTSSSSARQSNARSSIRSVARARTGGNSTSISRLPYTLPTRTSCKGKRYTKQEGQAILDFIVERDLFQVVQTRNSGIRVWKEMEAAQICGNRPFGGLRTHFFKSVLPKLDEYNISEDDKERMRPRRRSGLRSQFSR